MISSLTCQSILATVALKENNKINYSYIRVLFIIDVSENQQSLVRKKYSVRQAEKKRERN